MRFKVVSVKVEFTVLEGLSGCFFFNPPPFFFFTLFVDFRPRYVLDLARLVGILGIPWSVLSELLCASLYAEQCICVCSLFADGGHGSRSLGGKGTQGSEVSRL